MSVGITVGEGVELSPDDLRDFQDDVHRVLAEVCPRGILSVHLCGDTEIHRLNLTYRHKDAPTDVLSFPQDEPLLGDVVISVDTAERQALARGYDVHAELRVLAVHGICHLLGFDHHTPAETAAMRAEEGRLLGTLFGGSAPPGLVELAAGP